MNLKAIFLLVLATIVVGAAAEATNPPQEPSEQPQQQAIPAYCVAPSADASVWSTVTYRVSAAYHAHECALFHAATQKTNAEALKAAQADATEQRRLKRRARARAMQAEELVLAHELTITSLNSTVALQIEEMVAQNGTMDAQAEAITTLQSEMVWLKDSRNALENRLVRTTGNLNTCKTNLTASNNLITTLNNSLNTCKSAKKRYAGAVAFASWGIATYQDFVGLQIGTLTRLFMAQRQQHQASSLDLALAREYHNQTVVGSFLRWSFGGKNSTAAVMSAVATAGGPVLELMQEMQVQINNLTANVSDLGAELSTARATHATAIKDKDAAHAAEMASNDKAHAEAMDASAAAHATAMSGVNAALIAARGERDVCHDTQALAEERQNNTLARAEACETRRDECLRNATARAAEPQDEWVVDLARFLSPSDLPGVAMDRLTSVFFLLGGFFMHVFLMVTCLCALPLLSALLDMFLVSRSPDHWRPETPRHIWLFLVPFYLLWLGGVGWVCYALLPPGRVIFVGIVSLSLGVAWWFVPEECYFMEVINHIAYDLGLPVTTTHRVNVLETQVYCLERKLRTAYQYVREHCAMEVFYIEDTTYKPFEVRKTLGGWPYRQLPYRQ